jgi:Na+(H+)/acetate symporter ActP
MKKKLNKTVAPVIVSLCLIGYYIAGGIIVTTLPILPIIKLIALIVSIIITVVIIMVLIERIKEINGGETDDLGQY